MESQSLEVLVSLTKPYAKAPSFGSEHAAGADLYACIEPDTVIHIEPGQTKMVSLGIKTEIPNGYVGLVYARSGLATKEGLAPANKVGVIDSDYRGEWFAPLYNQSNETKTIKNGDRIAQVIIQEIPKISFITVDSDDLLSTTERDKGGFGSTGK